MATPVVEAFTTASSGDVEVTSIDLTKPAGVAVDELLLLIVGSDNFESSPNWGLVTGWTRFVNIGTGLPDAKLGCYWRVADGTEPATVTVATDSTDTNETWGFYLRISNVDTTAPINVVGTGQNAGSSSSHAIAEVTTTVDDCLAFYALAFDGGDGLPFSVSGAGWSQSAEVQADTIFSGASGTWGTKAIPTAGGTGVATVTPSATDGATYVQFAIASGGPPAQTIQGTLFVDPDGFGTNVLTPGPVTIEGSLFVDPDGFGINALAFPSQTIEGTLFVDPDGFGTNVLTPGPTTIQGSLFVDPDGFGANQLDIVSFAQTIQGSLFVDPDGFGTNALAIAGQVPALDLQYLYPLRDFPGDPREHRRRLAESQLRSIENTQQIQDTVNAQNDSIQTLQGLVSRMRWIMVPQMDLTNGGANDLTELMLIANLPATVTDIEVMLLRGSTTADGRPVDIQAGNATAWKTTGYQAGPWSLENVAPEEEGVTGELRFLRAGAVLAAEAVIGQMTFRRFGESSDQWFVQSSGIVVPAPFATAAPTKTGGGMATFDIADLTRLRAIVSQAGGAATMDAGSIMLRYRPGP